MRRRVFLTLGLDAILRTKYLSWKDQALVTIVLPVELSLLYLIGDPDDLAVVRKKLADQFQKKTWAYKPVLRRLYSLKLKEGDSVHKHIKLVTKIFEELSIIGVLIDEEDRVVHHLTSLSDSYDMLVKQVKMCLYER